MSVKTFLYSLFFSLIVALGLFGLLSSVLDNPTALLVQMVIVAIIVTVGLYLFRRLAGSAGKTADQAYKKAARQSVKRHKLATAGKKSRNLQHPSRLKVISTGSRTFRDFSRTSLREDRHLTVIDGKKAKKKKRVLF
ncbi:SA1362 family protein [Sporolactobacillus sp. Y61]|jgi:hypothetical protein|uniref:SA1362 family protein n=1 Tax=Sporolactobacillus sp. Y61 TaxID=3160863 RepID=A0AAU8IDZ5_9BACL